MTEQTLHTGKPAPGLFVKRDYRERARTDGAQSDASSTKIVIGSLRPADSPRLDGESAQHVEMLAQLEERLPPIVVHRGTMRVIDGMHRLRAAELRGEEVIEARFYEGTEEDGFVEGVRLNVAHGLPLSQSDRSAAALRIMQTHPSWSDRKIASVCGVAPMTVAAIRQRSTDQVGHLNARRVGKDGRSRPVNGAEGRESAKKFLTDNPEASLREIAAAAGIALGTAKDVRERFRRGEDVLPASQRKRNVTSRRTDEEFPDRPVLRPQEVRSLIFKLRRDPALRLNELGRSLLRLLSANMVDQQWDRIAPAVPAHCRDMVATAARQCAAAWLDLAAVLEEG